MGGLAASCAAATYRHRSAPEGRLSRRCAPDLRGRLTAAPRGRPAGGGLGGSDSAVTSLRSRSGVARTTVHTDKGYETHSFNFPARQERQARLAGGGGRRRWSGRHLRTRYVQFQAWGPCRRVAPMAPQACKGYEGRKSSSPRSEPNLANRPEPDWQGRPGRIPHGGAEWQLLARARVSIPFVLKLVNGRRGHLRRPAPRRTALLVHRLMARALRSSGTFAIASALAPQRFCA